MDFNGNEYGIQTTRSEPHWHALYARHQHEKSAALHLSNRGHEVFLPLYRAIHQWQDRAKQVWLPLFPCYLFARYTIESHSQIICTPGIMNVVGWAGHPAVVPGEQLEMVRTMIESHLQIEPHVYLACGDRVRVKQGSLQVIEGILTRKKGISRLVVSMEMLGRSAAVEIDVSCVERVAPSPLRTSPLSMSASA